MTNTKRMALIDPNYSGRRVEVGYEYLKTFFTSQSDFLKFLKNLDTETRETFLYSIHFYYHHDVFQLCPKMPKEKPLDIFIVTTTFAIIENLSQNIRGSRKRIKTFFTKNLKSQEKKEIELQDHNDSEKDSIDILYEARNDFIHRAQRFYFHNTNGFAEVNKIKGQPNNDPYLGIIKLGREKYIKLFWKAFLKNFNYKRAL